MSAEQLRARIVQLDSEIDLQKKLLRKLERDKSLVQRHLNDLVDPVARLPLEISSEIFLQTLPPKFQNPRAHLAPMLLLNICNTWSDIALSTPALWASIQIPCSNGLVELLPIWLQRAGNRPLSISQSVDIRSFSEGISAIIWQHGGQLKHLEISSDGDDDRNVSDVDTDIFGDTTPESLPLLETLAIHCSTGITQFLCSQIRNLLRLAPNVVEFSFDGGTAYDLDMTVEKLVLSRLRRLIFGNTDQILLYLSLPALETLSLPMCDISDINLLDFLEHSAPPLQELAVHCEFPDFDSLRQCLYLVPTLVRFEIRYAQSRIVANLFAALVDSPSLLPNLHSLTIDTSVAGSFSIPGISWRMLLGAFSTRRIIHLHIVGITLPPPPDVVATFRRLVVDGAQVHIGTSKHSNFIA